MPPSLDGPLKIHKAQQQIHNRLCKIFELAFSHQIQPPASIEDEALEEKQTGSFFTQSVRPLCGN